MDGAVYLNGIDGETGGYLSEQGLSIEQFARLAQVQSLDADHVQDLQARLFDAEGGEYALLPEYGDGSDLRLAGWGLIFPAEAPGAGVDAVLEALDPLIAQRQVQTGGAVRIYRGEDGVHAGERKADWLARHGAGMGPVDPEAVPFHLLIVAEPAAIPFQFQYELDIQYSVGRIYFETLDGFAAYARGVAQAEAAGGTVRRTRRATFFGTANLADGATQLSASTLVKPLAEYAVQRGAKLGAGWQAVHISPEQATRACLAGLLGVDAPGPDELPALVFSATHGLGWKQPDPRQRTFQGALICQDWPGPAAGPVRREHYLAAEDIPNAAIPAGMIAFFFACYGAGTPVWDDYAIAFNHQRTAISERPFLAALPQRLLGHPNGGALALVGHVERAWGFSFSGPDERAQTQAYRSVIYQLLAGKPLGVAMDALNLRYAEMAATLANQLQELSVDPLAVSANQLAYTWTAANDARGFIILGDPAVKI